MISTTNSPDQSKLWLAAIKPPMYTVAVIPIWVGSAIAIGQKAALQIEPLLIFLISAIAIIAWINLTNDVFDADTGIDRNKAHSIVNLTGNKSLIFWVANGFLVAGLGGVCSLSWMQHDPTILTIVALSCVLGYTYQGPPFRLGYQGLGEIICFITFGPMALAAAYYSQTGSWSPLIASGASVLGLGVAAIAIGLATSLILFCSHFHQVADDIAAGKRSPIVRLGTRRGANLLPWICGAIYIAPIAGVLFGALHPASMAMLLSLPLAAQLCRHVGEHYDRPEQVSNCKFIAVRMHFLGGLLFGLGAIAPLWF
jgi:1,4-dihydroxy-2-naphthoate octaprenyltransferase